MASKVNISTLDYGSERSNISFLVEQIDAANYNDIVGGGGVVPTLVTAIDGVTLATLAKEQVNCVDVILSSTPPTNQFAQREFKWLVQYSDDVTGKLYSAEIPGADLALLVPNTEDMNTASGAGQTFKNAWEAGVRTPDDNPVTVLGIKFVSRDL